MDGILYIATLAGALFIGYQAGRFGLIEQARDVVSGLITRVRGLF